MGYQARLDLLDQRQRRWTGVHTPSSVDLRPVFEPLLAEEGLEDGIEGVQERLPDSAEMVQMLGPRALALRVHGEGEVVEAVLKLVPPSARGPIDSLVHLHDGSRARRAHTMAHRLRAFGLGAPRPLGYLERARRPRSAPSLQVSAWVRAPDLYGWWREPGRSVAERRARLRQLALLLRGLHAQGFFHADLHAENLLVHDDEVLLLDLESVRTLTMPDRVIVKSFARLARDATTLGVSRSDRLRVLEEYLRHQSDRGARWRRLWRRVEARAAQRRVVVEAPASEEARADL